MRDDVFGGLSSFRQLTRVTTERRSTPGQNDQAHALPRPTFANALARASRAQQPRPAPKPYRSPLKGTQLPQPTRPPTTVHRPPTNQATSPNTLSRPGVSRTPPPARAQPTRPLPPPPPVESNQSNFPTGPLSLGAYPHPSGDNGRGLHWIPTTCQDHATIDKFVAEAQRMGVKWVTFLNDGAVIGPNDYLVKKLVDAGIEPVMRLYSPSIAPLQGDIASMVRHYVGMGVHYFQPFNEPNLSIENGGSAPSVDRYLEAWIPAARAIVAGGGLPGFGALSPGGDKDDVDFLREALGGLSARGAAGLLDRAWLSMHNYTHNHPIEERADTDGFFKFRAYNKILREALGRDIPIIGTEGGTFVGQREDTTLPAVDAATAVSMTRQAYTYMRDQREPWNFVYSFWTIANEAGGGRDQGFSNQALFAADGTRSLIVSTLQALG